MDELLEKMLMRPAEKLRNEKKLQKKIQNVDALRDLFLDDRRDRESPKDRDSRKHSCALAGGLCA